MNKEQQIEKAVQIIVDHERAAFLQNSCQDCRYAEKGKCDEHCTKYSNIYYDCAVLIDAGYGNVNEARKEFAEKIKEHFWQVYNDEEMFIGDLHNYLDELLKEYDNA